MAVHDVAIIGSGPGGLQSAIYTASEGLNTIVVDGGKVGGQIADTPKLENFAGQSDSGISGPEFIERIYKQALALGASFKFGNKVSKLRRDNGNLRLTLESGSSIVSRTVIIAVGMKYNILPNCGMDKQLGKTVFAGPFRCMSIERGLSYIVFGGGNSAGQAIISLSEHAKHVRVLCRSNLKMSDYLVKRIRSAENVMVLEDVNVNKVDGNSVRFDTSSNRHLKRLDFDYGFCCIGNTPNTQFLPRSIQLEDGFIKVDSTLQTSIAGVYAIGDVRSGVARRSVGNAIGDASTATANIHQFLQSNKAPRSSGD